MRNSFSNSPLTNSRKAVSPASAAIIIVALFVVGIAFAAYAGVITFPSQHTTTTQTGPNGQSLVTTAQSNTQCAPSTPQAVISTATHYPGDASLSNLQWNRYTSNNGGNTIATVTDNPGALTDGTPSSASNNNYAIGPASNGLSAQGPTWEQITQSSSPNAYPMWVGPLSASSLTTPVTEFGQNVFTVSCKGTTGNSAVSNWAMSGVLLEAPTSGASATTNVKATIAYAGGTSAPTAWPTTASLWNVELNDFSAYKVAGASYAECGTNQNQVENFATSTTYLGCVSGPGQGGLPTVGTVMIIAANVSAISISVGPGFTMTPISGLPTGDRAWVVTTTGLGYIANTVGPAPSTGVSTSTPSTQITVPVTAYETKSQGSSTGTVCFGFVDMQQAAYLSSYFNVPAPTTYTSGHWCQSATGSNAALPGNFNTLTPTTQNNAGNPSPLIDQWYTLDSMTY